MIQFKSVKPLIVIFSLSLAVGCSLAEQTKSTSTEKNLQASNLHHALENKDTELFRLHKSIKNIKNDLKIKIQDNPANRMVFEDIYQQEKGLEKLIESCDKDLNPHYTQIREIYQVSHEKYVIELTCTIGINIPYFRFFLYTNSTGIQLEPLKLLTIKIPYEDSNTILEETSHLIGSTKYDETTKDISIIENCTIGYGVPDCSVLSNYKFENDKLVLREVFADLKHDNKLSYKRVYP